MDFHRLLSTVSENLLLEFIQTVEHNWTENQTLKEENS